MKVPASDRRAAAPGPGADDVRRRRRAGPAVLRIWIIAIMIIITIISIIMMVAVNSYVVGLRLVSLALFVLLL